MAMSTQRLIIMFFMLNLVIGMVQTTYEGVNHSLFQTDTWSDQMDREGQNLQIYENTLFDEDDLMSSARTTGLETEATIGNSLSWGKVIWSILTNSAIPWSVSPNDFNSSLEKFIAWLLIIFRGLLMVLAILEMYMLIKNKKTY